ncbi:MAG: hypothetical protein U9Q81_18115 [Pseudomonadota bacterium]|nr:hypothetical protein [Pseudomonadota bacterium]
MTTEHEELNDEHPAITAAIQWAGSDHSVDWDQVARVGDSFAESLSILNSHRRRAMRVALLEANGREKPKGDTPQDEDLTPEKAAGMAITELGQILGAVEGRLSPAALGFIRYLSEHPEGAGAMRAWSRHVGFSNSEITWLFEELEKVDHEFFRLLESANGLDTLLEHTYCGSDMTKFGFMSVEGSEVPPALAQMVVRFAAKGVTPSIFHLIPVAGAMVYLADEVSEHEVSHPAFENTLFAMISARGDCYSTRTCSGKILGRRITTKTCKRIRGKSLRSAGVCIKV